MSFTRMHLLERWSDTAHCGWGAGHHWRGNRSIEGGLRSRVWSFIAFGEAGEPTRGGSTWLGRRLAILTGRTNSVTRDVSYLAGRTVATPKSRRPTTRRRHGDCNQPSVVARLISRESMKMRGKMKSEDLERNERWGNNRD
jgi:hypothetical protein